MTIGRKLIGGFLGLAFLVLTSGVVGIIVLNKVSSSADNVAKQKAPIQNAVMNAALSVDRVQKQTIKFTASVDHLDEIDTQIKSSLAEFDMWISILQFGTESKEFINSPAHKIYQNSNRSLVVPKSSPEMLSAVSKIMDESKLLQTKITQLVSAHRQLIGYGVIVDSRMLTLPDFLNFAQRTHLDWTRQLKDAVNIETKFTGNTDPTVGLIGEWLNSYQVDNGDLMAIRDNFKKQYAKMLGLAVKINALDVYKKKQRTFNRGIGITAKIEKYFKKLHELSNTIYTDLNSANSIKQEELNTSVIAINEQLDDLIATAGAEMELALRETATTKSKGVTFLIGLTIVAGIVAVALGIIVSRYLSTKILSIAESTKKIAEGDLKKKLEITSNDELGDLAGDTNTMIVNLREMIGKILSFSDKLTMSAKDLSGVSTDLDGNTVDLETKSKAAGEATTEMNESMANISNLANDSMQRVQNVSHATDDMNTTFGSIAENTEQAKKVTNKAVATVENTTVKMNELSEAATEIGKVADVIVSISEQTNLLSLNATIEAARAGEAGKGFAIVANEVKELAGQTNMATEDIRLKIAAIQRSSDMTISEITEITEIINQINSIVVSIAGAVEEQTSTTQKITDDLNSVSESITGMTELVESATDTSDSVAEDISQVKVTSNTIGEQSINIQVSAEELEKLADELNGLVGQFKL